MAYIKKKSASKHQNLRKKNTNKIGSNDKNLRKLEPQQKQRVLIKKKSVFPV